MTLTEQEEDFLRFANIIVDISHEKLDRPFQYIIPEKLYSEIRVGSQVEVPFGKGGRVISGYVMEITDTPEIEISRIKEIIGVKKGSLAVESQLISLAWFIKEQYGSTMNKALKTVIPIKKSVKQLEKKYVSLNVSKDEARDLYEKYRQKKNQISRAVLIKELCETDVIEKTLAVTKLQVSESVIKGLEKSGIIKIETDTVYRNPVNEISEIDYNIKLNDEQKNVADEINISINNNENKTHLIFGVTGSGKTEVYMEIISNVIQKGKEAIVLIPEIALTYQTIKRFYKRFGNQVSIINSKLSAGEKFDQFERAKNGEVKIMIGPRSALFTPFRNLGLIVIDEEHEGAYKSDQVPKYHAREVAVKRAEIAGATVVLGSATPSVSSYYKALNGEYVLHSLENRAKGSVLPKVHLVDLKQELEAGNKEIFSRKLVELIKDRLDDREQIILFINRRGYSSFVSCRSCGKAIKCPHCDVSLTLHKNKGEKDKLVCHYCGYTIDMPDKCPKCSSKYIGRFGLGTEQVEDKVKSMFPKARTLRMDMDTTRGKGDYENILSAFANEEADILIGTQMIVKGHDFPNVTLVGIIAADLSLNASDYNASERTFELLTQAAGRAGRGKKGGEVVIQTYSPEEPCIISAVKQDYVKFYENEIIYRKAVGYPPTYSIMAILISDKNEAAAWTMVSDIADRIVKTKIEGLVVLGPAKASISKINDIYRNVIYIKHLDGDVLIRVKNAVEKYISMKEAYKNISVQFDFNPLSGY